MGTHTETLSQLSYRGICADEGGRQRLLPAAGDFDASYPADGQRVDCRPQNLLPPRACVFGCPAEDSLQHFVECGVLRGAASEAGGEGNPFFGVLADSDLDWAEVARAAEVYNSAARKRNADADVQRFCRCAT